MGIQKDRVRFNFGGRIFETTSTTLANAGRNSLFGAMFDENWDLQPIAAAEHFIDRNPDCFAVLLDLLRTGELYIPPNIPEKLLYSEALFYGLLDHVRTARWGPFDGNRLHFSSMNDGISVFCGPDWVLTSRLKNSRGGSICDFSIGGDRLFALHSEENVFDIWETRPPPII